MHFKIHAKFVLSRDKYFLARSRDKNVLHIGACDAPYTLSKYEDGLLLHDKLEGVCKSLLGIDVDATSIKLMNELGFTNIIQFDLNDIGKLDFLPDVIILGETIEHLTNLDNLFKNVKKMMNKNCELLISTPNPFYLGNFVNALKSSENTHEDHKLYCSPQTLQQLLTNLGFRTEEVLFSFLDREKESAKKRMMKTFARCFPMLSETLIVRCKST